MNTLSRSIPTPSITSSPVSERLSSRVYGGNDFLLFITNKLNSKPHQHPAIQLNISLSGETISVDDGNNVFIGHNLLIDSNQNHQIRSHCRWQAVLLLATHSVIARHLQSSQLQNNQGVAQLPDDKNQLLKNALLNLATTEPTSGLLITRLAEVFFSLHTISASSTPLVDPRLKKVFTHLYQSTETTISHLKLAKSVAISGSHLSRFFSQGNRRNVA